MKLQFRTKMEIPKRTCLFMVQLYCGKLDDAKKSDIMMPQGGAKIKKAKHNVYIGAGIQILVMILLSIFILLGQAIPDYGSNMFYAGLL